MQTLKQHRDTQTALEPCERLLFAILGRAWADAHGKNERERRAALRWLRSKRCYVLCELLGLEYSCLRAKLPKA